MSNRSPKIIIIKKCCLKKLLYLLSNLPLQKRVFDLKRLSVYCIFSEPVFKSELIFNRVEDQVVRIYYMIMFNLKV